MHSWIRPQSKAAAFMLRGAVLIAVTFASVRTDLVASAFPLHGVPPPSWLPSRESGSRTPATSIEVDSPVGAKDWTGLASYLPADRSRSTSPTDSLRRGEWFKLICGASFEDVAAVRNLALIYTLAGADCIDVAADEAVVEAARDGVSAAHGVANRVGYPVRMPWLMISVNDDDEDPHFRKAVFDPVLCPPECPRPCEAVCPADAIVCPGSPAPAAQRATMVADLFDTSPRGGVLEPRCYGCGRCIDVCPPSIIRAQKYQRSPAVLRRLLEEVDAVEIHTKGDLMAFRGLWERSFADSAPARSLKVVAVSIPDLGANMGDTMLTMDSIMRAGSASSMASRESWLTGRRPGKWGQKTETNRPLNVWQTDGRPMSGDIGIGATTACVRLAQQVLATRALPFGEGQHFVQLAGGTNARTAPKLRELGLLQDSAKKRSAAKTDHGFSRAILSRKTARPAGIGGIAYGGYARKIVSRILDELPGGSGRVEEYPEVLLAAVREASVLVRGLKLPE